MAPLGPHNGVKVRKTTAGEKLALERGFMNAQAGKIQQRSERQFWNLFFTLGLRKIRDVFHPCKEDVFLKMAPPLLQVREPLPPYVCISPRQLVMLRS